MQTARLRGRKRLGGRNMQAQRLVEAEVSGNPILHVQNSPKIHVRATETHEPPHLWTQAWPFTQFLGHKVIH